MSRDTIGLVMLWAFAPPATLYPIIFAFTTPWRRTSMGRPMLEATVGLAMLLDLALAFRVFGDYPGRENAVLVAFGVIGIAVWDKFIALMRQKVREYRKIRALRAVRERADGGTPCT